MARKRKDPNEMSFLEHLEELRWHLIRSTLAVFIMAVVAFIYHNIIFDRIILAPKDPSFFTNRMLCRLGQLVHVPKLCINSKPLEIININMAGQFTTHIMVSLLAGLIVAIPYVFWEFWRFMRPALYEKEKRYARGAVFYSSLLFLLGVLFGYYIIAPLSVNFLGSYSVSQEVINRINLRSYISTVTTVTLAGGITFELPVIVYFLTRIGLITPDFLRRYRRHAIVVILLLAAIITPPDVFSQILVFIPLVILYEVSIWISSRVMKKHGLYGGDGGTSGPPSGGEAPHNHDPSPAGPAATPSQGEPPQTPEEPEEENQDMPDDNPYPPYSEMTGEGSVPDEEEQEVVGSDETPRSRKKSPPPGSHEEEDQQEKQS